MVKKLFRRIHKGGFVDFSKFDAIQIKAKNAVLKSLMTNGSALLQMATGTGKTNTAKKILDKLLKKNPKARILWLTHSNELIEQTANRILLYTPNMNVSIYNGETKDRNGQVVIASIQTISRPSNLEKFNEDEFDFIFVDEAHHTPAITWKRILGHFKKSKKFGFTATPYRPDGQSLYDFFGKPVFELSFRKAQKEGLLAQNISYVILTNSSLKPIVTKEGEYSPKELDRLYVSKDRNEIIIKSYLKYGRQEMKKSGLKFKSICYCINTEHAKRMSKIFRAAGLTSEFIVGDTRHQTSKERGRIYETFRDTFDIEILCVVNIFNEAIDIPDLACALMARPTRSNIVYSQQVGRPSRIVPGYKNNFIVLDFVDNTRREYQGYIMSNLLQTGISYEQMVVEYLNEKDPIVVSHRIKNIMKGVEEFENRIKRICYWDYETLIQLFEQRQFTSFREFSEEESGALDFFHGKLTKDQRSTFMKKYFSSSPYFYRSKEEVIQHLLLKKYKSITEWYKGDGKVYAWFLKNIEPGERAKILLTFFPNKTNKTVWTKEKIIDLLASKKYKSIADWNEDTPGPYKFFRSKIDKKNKDRIKSQFFPRSSVIWDVEKLCQAIEKSGATVLQKFREACGGGEKFLQKLDRGTKDQILKKYFKKTRRSQDWYSSENVIKFLETKGIKNTKQLKNEDITLYRHLHQNPKLKHEVFSKYSIKTGRGS